MFNERTQKLPQDEQSALVSLWNALGLSYQNYTEHQSYNKQVDEADEKLALLDHDVLVHYQSENPPDANELADNGRRHVRHTVDGDCQYRMHGMTHYGQAVLHNISASGLGISTYRKLELNTSITVLIETDKPAELPLMVRATVTREAGTTNDALYHYGCTIERVINPNG